MFDEIFLQALMLKAGAPERIGAAGIHTNPVTSPRHVATQLQVIARGNPRTTHRHRDGLRLAKQSVPVHFSRDDLGEIAPVHRRGDVVDDHQRWRFDRMLVNCLRHSSDSAGADINSAARPVRIIAITSASSVLPVP